MLAFRRNNFEYSWVEMLLRFQREIEKYSLQLLKGLGLISTSPLKINKKLQRHTTTHSTIFWNIKYETQNFVLIFKTLPLDRNKTQKKK